MIFALGAFDGFHRGHQLLLDCAAARAKDSGDSWGVITFDGHPQMLFNKKGFKYLFSNRERDLLAAYFGIPKMVKIEFSRLLAEMTPNRFIDYIAEENDISGLVVGENFRFGHVRLGTPELLSELCGLRGWSFDKIDSFQIDGQIVSSTLVRERIIRGDVAAAHQLLGHPFLLSGKVVAGDGRGTKLGYPTANLAVHAHKVYPARGSYAALTSMDGAWRPAALNIGFNPTFEGIRSLRCEAHIDGIQKNLYGEKLTLFLVGANRGEVRFSGENELRAQLGRDLEKIKRMAADYLEANGSILRGFEKIPL